MSKNVSLNKSLGIDGISDKFFDIARHKNCKKQYNIR